MAMAMKLDVIALAVAYVTIHPELAVVSLAFTEQNVNITLLSNFELLPCNSKGSRGE
jgi:hypothetical protein